MDHPGTLDNRGCVKWGLAIVSMTSLPLISCLHQCLLVGFDVAPDVAAALVAGALAGLSLGVMVKQVLRLSLRRRPRL